MVQQPNDFNLIGVVIISVEAVSASHFSSKLGFALHVGKIVSSGGIAHAQHGAKALRFFVVVACRLTVEAVGVYQAFLVGDVVIAQFVELIQRVFYFVGVVLCIYE